MFKQMVIIDKTGLQEWAIDRLSKYSEEAIIIYDNIPATEEEAAKRIEKADCVFVSWNTKLPACVLSRAKNLKYVGMCCSLYDRVSANVDIDYADNNGITVKGVRDYGDEGLVEYIISELIRLLKGFGDNQWREDAVELTGRKVGIIGMGTTGKMLADRLKVFGSKISYYDKSINIQAQDAGYDYLPLDQLLASSEIISLHLPRNTVVLGEEEFKLLGNGKILANTSLGLTFDKKAFEKWIANKSNYAIIDGVGLGQYKEEFDMYENIISTDIVSGWTEEAKGRLSAKVLDNIVEFIDDGSN